MISGFSKYQWEKIQVAKVPQPKLNETRVERFFFPATRYPQMHDFCNTPSLN